MSILRTENLMKKYGNRVVVQSVSFSVKQGEIVGLLGPNGAGKTTSFYMVMGLINPDGGRILLDDQDITSEPVYKRARYGIGYLAQEASVFRTLSVEDNIMSILEMTKRTKKEQKDKLEELLTDFNLLHIRKNLGIQLSGGERRRTEIARALASDPKFILLDEPFAGVDPIAVEEIQRDEGDVRQSVQKHRGEHAEAERRFGFLTAPDQTGKKIGQREAEIAEEG